MAGSDEQKRTNEIGMAIPLLDGCDVAGRMVTADALLTQHALAHYLIGRQAHYSFTVKGNQPTLARDIALLFEKRGAPDFVEVAPADHGRIETRRIWCSMALNDYLDFSHVGQVFLIERESIEKKTGKLTRESALGITSHTSLQASSERVLAINRGHWAIESTHYIIDWNFDEDRSRIRYRPRPGKHHSPAPLRRRHPQVISERFRIHCRDDAQAQLPHSSRLRLLAHDKKLHNLTSLALRTNLP